MRKLTDIRTPETYFHGGQKPTKESFLKKVLQSFLAVILAPILWPWRLLRALYLAVKKFLLNTIGSVLTGIKNIFGAIPSKIRGAASGNYVPNNWAGWLVLFLAFIVIWQLLVTANVLPSLAFPADKTKWQAVFLTNNQVYFGHLREAKGGYTVLEDVYYLSNSQSGQSSVDLIKLGSEVHGPEDQIFIPKEQIMFWENLKSDSQVVRIINRLEGN